MVIPSDLNTDDEKVKFVRQFCDDVTDKLDQINKCLLSNIFVKTENIEGYLFFDEARRTADLGSVLCNDWDQGFLPEMQILECIGNHHKNISNVFRNHGINQIRQNLSLRCWHLRMAITQLEPIYSKCKLSSKIVLNRVKNQDKIFVMLGMTPCFSNID
uniref:Uncharacterized protein n=1 Tax=Panagrolaimus sp. JU765 TaxID=591449 RepID=A0AC34QKF0_9BILA